MNFEYNKSSSTFTLSDEGKVRVVFNDFELNFRMTRLSMLLGRIHPEEAVTTDKAINYPVKLWGMGSSKTIPLNEVSGQICATTMDNSLLLSYKNDFKEENFSPDQAVRIGISNLPGIRKSIFYHNRSNEFQNFDCEGLWWSQSVFVDDVSSDLSHDWGLLSCWQYDDGIVGGVLPITNNKVLGRLRGSKAEGLSIISCTGKSGEVIEDYPLALIAFSNSVDELINKLFADAKTLYSNIRFRNQDSLPKLFNSLGWCSWNAFGHDVTENDIKQSIDQFKKDNVPFRYIILDDGWSEIEKTESVRELEEGMTASTLKSYQPDREKFPNGLNPLIEYARKSGIESFGVWHALNGYWHGISPDAEMVAEHPDWFITAEDGKIIPAPNGKFYESWHNELKEAGVDFLKIDNQGFHRQCLPYTYNMPEYMAGIQNNLKTATEKNNFPVIHCMATHPETFFNCGHNQLLRISNDFKPDDSFGSRKHLVNNFYNCSWLSKIFWPDFDMFQTNDIYAEALARMLSISGAPIYTTDKPENINVEMLRRMALPSGKIPRYDDFAKVLSSRFFENPYAEGNILAVTVEKHGITTLGLFNTIETDQSCSGTISLKELGIKTDCFVYSDAGQFEPQIIKADSDINFSLENMKSDLITISPIKDGFALIGVTDYFAAPAVIETVTRKDNSINIYLKDKGMLVVYSETEPVSITCQGKKMKKTTRLLPSGNTHGTTVSSELSPITQPLK